MIEIIKNIDQQTKQFNKLIIVIVGENFEGTSNNLFYLLFIYFYNQITAILSGTNFA